ncbi:putative bis-tetraphosphatase [Sporormia fimetaria CBS 119925]|uniref:Bis-tetraphosphatase n=1 Tax=Sporormia fimetaria CBS 119925 TaxID=1340428 RepID=A0A6A6VP60_9PLEO|nr:putative bis-tetraphosphatase [Sporormia fimetaria CBS 119925]
MVFSLSSSLPKLVESQFLSAKASSALLFSPTSLTVIRTSQNIPFQLRYCPALSKKPTAARKEDTGAKQKPDPFDNPPSDLLIAQIPENNSSHVLVLNKFPVIAGHFILATKAYEPQTHALEQDDLEATYACLKAWQEDGEARVASEQRKLFAFFNSGEHSGASQPHRHLQFLPVESMKGEDGQGWELLVDLILAGSVPLTKDPILELLHHPSLPFQHFAVRLPPSPSASDLYGIYTTLYTHAKNAVDTFHALHPDPSLYSSPNPDSLPISYNLAMTTDAMVIVPRRREGRILKAADATEVGFVALNGTVLGGTLMVKKEEEWDLLRERPELLDGILEGIGIPMDK